MSPVASTRWCPTTEQIMILEEMYRGGIRTPNATQIQQITAHLSLYGKIEGKNVFYWFQNHKARDRQKLRKRLLGKQLHLHQPQQQKQQQKQMVLPININNNFQQQLPNNNNYYQNFLHNQLHFDENPARIPRYPLPYSPLIGIHQLNNFTSTNNGFSPINYNQGMTHSHQAWKTGITETNYTGREKSMPIRKSDDYNWIMTEDHDHDHHDYGDDDDDDDEEEEEIMECDTTTRPLKTLQLFPIKEKTSLKENPNLSPPTHFQTYF